MTLCLYLSPLLCAIVAAVPPRAQSSALFELSIIHLNDFHARFQETNWHSGPCPRGREDTCVGGFPRIYTEVNRLLKERPNAVFVNAGDNYQGTLWYSIHRWNVTQYFLNKLHTDAMTLGNHEFDDGIAGVVPFLDTIKWPVVVANIDDSLEPEIQGKYQKSMVIERGGRKIGIVGFITNITSTISSSEKLVFLPEVESVAKEVANVKAQGVDIIVGLSHAGLDTDIEVAKHVPDIDVIVGGHSHTLLYTGTPPRGDIAEDVYPLMVKQDSGRLVAIVQAAAYTKYLGNLTAWFDSHGELVAAEGNPILLDTSVRQDPDILREMQPWQEAIDEISNEVVGRTKVFLDDTNFRCYKGECNIGSLLAEAHVSEFVDKAEPGSWTYAAIGIINAGSIRTSIAETNDELITFGDIATCQPFGNTVDTVELQGVHLLAMLEQSVSDESWKKRSKIFFGLGSLQYSGIHVTFDIGRPVGQRIVDVTVRCAACRVPRYEPVDPNHWYRIALTSFLVGGGDGFTIIGENMRNHQVGRLDLDVYKDYLKKNSPITQGLDGRIRIIQADL